MPNHARSASRPVIRFDADGRRDDEDRLAIEEPLEIRIGDEPLAVTMRTPGDDRELAAGFCLTEGVIGHPDDLVRVERCLESEAGNVVRVILTDEVRASRREQIQCATRDLYLSSSCGLCGKQTLDRIEQQTPDIAGRFTVTRDTIASLTETMRAKQATFDQTGGLHAAAIFDTAGNLRHLREDVGRHNAVDKVIGQAVLLNEIPLDPAVLLVSGRSSFEIMQKAAMAGIAFVAAVSAPSSLAVDFATRMNITLVGFLRPGRMNVYHDGGRVTGK